MTPGAGIAKLPARPAVANVDWGDFSRLYKPLDDEMDRTVTALAHTLVELKCLGMHYDDFASWCDSFCERCRNGL